MSEGVESSQMSDVLKKGAKNLLVKPIMADDVRDMWKICKLWKTKVKIDNSITRRSLKNLRASSFTTNPNDISTSKKSLIYV